MTLPPPDTVLENWNGVLDNDFSKTIKQTFHLPDDDDEFVYHSESFAMPLSQIQALIDSGKMKYHYRGPNGFIAVSSILSLSVRLLLALLSSLAIINFLLPQNSAILTPPRFPPRTSMPTSPSSPPQPTRPKLSSPLLPMQKRSLLGPKWLNISLTKESCLQTRRSKFPSGNLPCPIPISTSGPGHLMRLGSWVPWMILTTPIPMPPSIPIRCFLCSITTLAVSVHPGRL